MSSETIYLKDKIFYSSPITGGSRIVTFTYASVSGGNYQSSIQAGPAMFADEVSQELVDEVNRKLVELENRVNLVAEMVSIATLKKMAFDYETVRRKVADSVGDSPTEEQVKSRVLYYTGFSPLRDRFADLYSAV